PSSPPLATPLYRPAPMVVPKRAESDFDDLPGEKITLPAEESAPAPVTPPTSQEQPLQPKRADALDNLIQQVQ
ncbi:hypothetical protein, partial [Acinetobacter sp. RF14B]